MSEVNFCLLWKMFKRNLNALFVVRIKEFYYSTMVYIYRVTKESLEKNLNSAEFI